MELINLEYVNSADIVQDSCKIIETSQALAYKSINYVLLQRNWLLGRRIAEEELKGGNRADYGVEIIKNLAKSLTKIYGKGFTWRILYYCVEFYKNYPNILHSVNAKSQIPLSFTHYRILLQVKDTIARSWYEQEALKECWAVRTLQRNISSQYYYRLLKSQNKEKVTGEMKTLTDPYQKNKLEFIKNPMITEFLGLSSSSDYTESDLEKSIISNLQKFLMEKSSPKLCVNSFSGKNLPNILSSH